jgi:hypothetical protein
MCGVSLKEEIPILKRETCAKIHVCKRDLLWEFETLKLWVFGVLRCKLQNGRRSEPCGRTPGFKNLEDFQIEKSG